jgi:hypothetical protein
MRFKESSLTRHLALALAMLLVRQPASACASQAQAAPAPAAGAMLNIVVVKGEGAINNIKQRTAREIVIQVEDENRKPVAGAAVAFLLPNSGPSAVFADGGNMFTAVTDQNGRVSVQSLKPNQTVGNYSINVTASHSGLRAAIVIGQSNILPVTIAGMSVGLFALVAGAAAAAGIALAVNANSGSSPDNNRAKVTIGQPRLP